jgi:hypothetical protein
MTNVQVGETNLADIVVLKEIIRARRPLKAGAKNEHPHSLTLLTTVERE